VEEKDVIEGADAGSTRPAAGPRHARVSVVDVTFALWVCVIALLFNHGLLNGDGDLARHLMIGGHILEHGPRFNDPFSFTRFGEPFLAYEWLSQATYAVVHMLAGLPGVTLLAAGLLAGSFALATAYVRRRTGDPWLAFITGAAAAVMSYPHWLARPHLFSFLGLAILLHVLHSSRRLVWLALLFAFWANLHPGFLYGLVMLACWSFGSALEDLRRGTTVRIASRQFLILLPAVLATFVNPFGWGLHVHAVGLLRSEMVKTIAEFMPLVVYTVYGLAFVAVIGLLVVAFAAQREWPGWHVLVVFWAAFVAALVVRRNAPMFALFALPVTAQALAPLVRDLPQWAFGRMRAEFARSDRRGGRIGILAAVLLGVLVVADSRTSALSILPDTFSAEAFPEAAIMTARQAGVEGRLLSQYRWGGYVLYTWPGQRVFVDSMADFFGEELVEEYRSLQAALPGWKEKLARHDISLVLFPPTAPISKALRETEGWSVLHEDDVAVLFVRTS
jgi:hypothetical protein